MTVGTPADAALRQAQRCLHDIARRVDLNAFVVVDDAGALDDARRASTSSSPGWLTGVPIAVKQNLWVRSLPCTAGSRILEGLTAPRDATVVARLRSAGGMIVGLTNMDELGMGGSTELGTAGPTRHPTVPGRVVGGSSGGSAAAVAAGLVPVALGPDTGGSIRQPAAFCGVVGPRPTWGRVSRHGLVAFASALDTVGPLSTTVAAAAATLQTIAGRDPHDATTSRLPVGDLVAATSRAPAGLVVGRVRPHVRIDPEIEIAIDRAAARLAAAGARIVEAELPHAAHGLSAYLVLASADASSNLARFDGVRYGRRAAGADDLDDLVRRSRAEGFGPEVQRRVLIGTYVLSEGYTDAYHTQAARVRTLIIRDYQAAFDGCDVLLGPTTPEPAFLAKSRLADPLAMYRADEFTVGPSLAGLPAISVPGGRTQAGLPIGVQLVAPWWREATLLTAAAAVETEPLRSSLGPAAGTTG